MANILKMSKIHAIREVKNKEIKLIEVTYAGTHEKAPY